MEPHSGITSLIMYDITVFTFKKKVMAVTEVTELTRDILLGFHHFQCFILHLNNTEISLKGRYDILWVLLRVVFE